MFADEIGKFSTLNLGLKITVNLLPHNNLWREVPNHFSTIPPDGVCAADGILPAENAFEKALFRPSTPRGVIFARAGAAAKITFSTTPGRNTRSPLVPILGVRTRFQAAARLAKGFTQRREGAKGSIKIFAPLRLCVISVSENVA